MDKYLTELRIKSLRIYLNDCAYGVDYHTAWKEHKARMQEPNEINVMVDDLATLEQGMKMRDIAESERKTMFAISGEPCAEKTDASKTWLMIKHQCDAFDQATNNLYYRKPQL